MIIQYLLSGGLLLPLIYVFLSSTINNLLKLLMFITFVIGQFFIWFPEKSTLLANFIGVGRGADLILYLWILVSILLVAINVINTARVNSDITVLARKLAILEAQLKDKNTTKNQD